MLDKPKNSSLSNSRLSSSLSRIVGVWMCELEDHGDGRGWGGGGEKGRGEGKKKVKTTTHSVPRIPCFGEKSQNQILESCYLSCRSCWSPTDLWRPSYPCKKTESRQQRPREHAGAVWAKGSFPQVQVCPRCLRFHGTGYQGSECIELLDILRQNLTAVEKAGATPSTAPGREGCWE